MTSRRHEVVKMIIADCEADVDKLETRAFTGKQVAEVFGELYAVVQALAKVIDSMLEEETP